MPNKRIIERITSTVEQKRIQIFIPRNPTYIPVWGEEVGWQQPRFGALQAPLSQ